MMTTVRTTHLLVHTDISGIVYLTETFLLLTSTLSRAVLPRRRIKATSAMLCPAYIADSRSSVNLDRTILASRRQPEVRMRTNEL